MHRLVPDFILQQFENRNQHGAFLGIALFVDVSGFAALTEAMLHHAASDAEVLADSITRIFSPLQEAVHESGGYIANFAGDAFVAVFPQENGTVAMALQAAARIQICMKDAGTIDTRVGSFPLRTRLGMASGEIEWGILNDARQSVYYFRGAAILESMRMENLAKPGEWIISRTLQQEADSLVDVLPVGNGWSVTGLRTEAGLDVLPSSLVAEPEPLASAESLSAFFPSELIHSNLRGEFRQVVSVFLSIRGVPDHAGFQELAGRFLSSLKIYQGYLCRVDFSEDDCRLLLFWGAPFGVEHSLERATNFILMVQAASSFPIRAGMTYGLAYAGFVGAGRREEYTCYSGKVNLAARMMSAAGWGEIWLGSECARRVKRSFQVRSRGAYRFKGFSRRQHVYELLGAGSSPPPLYHGKMQGRGVEFARLDACLQPVFDGRFTGVIYLYGEAGQGKSRLAYELSCHLGRSVTWFETQTDELLHTPFSPFRVLVSRYFNQKATDSPDNRCSIFNRRFSLLMRKMRQANETGLAAELERTRSVLAAFVGLTEEGSLWEHLDAKGRYENTLYAVKALLLAESRLRPLVLFIDDGHWLDDDSRTLLSVLTRGAQGYPLAILSALRYADDGSHPGWGLDGTPASFIELSPLDDEHVRGLAEAQLGGPVSRSLLHWLVEKTGGNPFYTEQFLLDARERKSLSQAGGEWSLLPSRADEIPEDINAILIARIDRLSAGVQDVVKAAAILGNEFEVDVLARMLENELAHGSVAGLVVDAERQGIWLSSLRELLYLFRHALMRDAAYEMQLAARRRFLHASAMDAMEMLYASNLSGHYAQLAFHAEHAGVAERQKEYLGLAADQSASEYKNAAALSYYMRLLPLLTLEIERIETLLKLGSVLEFMGSWQETECRYVDALERANQLGERLAIARCQKAMGNLFQKQGKFSAALEWLEKAYSGFQLLGDERLQAETLGALGNVCGRTGDFEAALRYLDAFLELSRQLGDQNGVAHALHNLGNVAWSRGEYPQAESYYSRSLKLRQELGDRWGVATSLNNLGSLALNRGDYEIARKYYEESLSIRQEQGDLPGVASVRDNLGIVEWNRGEFASARKLHEDALTFRREIGDLPGMATTLCNLGNVFWLTNEHVAARACFEESLTLRRSMGNKRGIAIALDSLALSLDALGDTPAAAQTCIEGLSLNLEIANRLGCAYALLTLGYILREIQITEAVRIAAAGERAFMDLDAEIQKYYLLLLAQVWAQGRKRLEQDEFVSLQSAGKTMTWDVAALWAIGCLA